MEDETKSKLIKTSKRNCAKCKDSGKKPKNNLPDQYSCTCWLGMCLLHESRKHLSQVEN